MAWKPRGAQLEGTEDLPWMSADGLARKRSWACQK